MNRLARASGIAVSALTAATATVMLLLPGHARLEMPGATASDGSSTGDATVTSHAVTPAGSGSPGSGPTRGLTVSGGGSPSAFGGGQAGSHSTGGRDALSAGPLRPAVPPRSLRLPAVSSLLSPAGTIGDPGVRCLHSYVWRRAYQGDYVCVTPGTRALAVIDNAAASSRMASGGYTCQPGYVWRQVAPTDYVCVTPASRAQAAADNAQANNRVALLSLWLSDWTPPGRPAQQDCSETDCSAAGVGWGGANFQINGDHFNVGPVLLQIRRNDGTVLWSTTVAATVYPGFAGGALYAQTPADDCFNMPGTSKNDYAIAYDTVSGRWSNEVPLDSGCASS